MKRITKWKVPKGGGAPHLCQPNIPHPLHGCLRGDAEVMTAQGWKRIDEITTNDLIATWDADTEKIIWDYPYETVRKYYKQMVRIKYEKYSTFGIFVSPDHRIPVRAKTDGRVQKNGIRVTGPKKWHLKDTTAAKINLSQFQHFITAARNGSLVDNELTDLERIYIAIQADGFLRRDTMKSTYHNLRYEDTKGLRAYRMSFIKERKKERFERLCESAGVKMTRQNHQADGSYAASNCQRYDVWVEPDCKNLWNCFDITNFSQKKAQQFLDEVALWDGSCAETCGILNRRYVTTVLDNAKFAQAVAVIAGATSSFQVRPADPDKNMAETYIVDFLDRDFRATQSCIKEVEEYDDYAYCVNVPTSYFVARDADSQSVMITGNCAPRAIMGTKAWNLMRHECYAACDYHCEICGAKCDRGKLHAHELYDFDYKKKTSTFVRLIGVCVTCHTGVIHSGRAITCYKNHAFRWTKKVMLDAAEHGFQLVHKWNKLHPDDKPLRMFQTFKDWLKEPTLTEDLQALIDKYEIKFYGVPPTDTEDDWGKWKLIYNGAEYYSPYQSQAEWEAAMQENNQREAFFNKDLFDTKGMDELAEVAGQEGIF